MGVPEPGDGSSITVSGFRFMLRLYLADRFLQSIPSEARKRSG